MLMKTEIYYPKLFFVQRLTARIIDVLIILVISTLFDIDNLNLNASFFVIFILYNIIVITIDGQTIGRYFLSIQINAKHSGLNRRMLLLVREILFLVFLPIIAISLLTFPHCLIHDRICFTFVIKDEK